jgi:hypothetical protein
MLQPKRENILFSVTAQEEIVICSEASDFFPQIV